jgi:Tol biopolymer transport system component
MSRARTTLVAALALAMLASACSVLKTPVSQGQTPGAPNPANSILVSVPSDTIYMVDPANGDIAPVASGLTDFQSGYASWSPKHRRIAYGQAGIRLLTPGSDKVTTPIKGQLVSMPSWSPNGKQLVYGNGTEMFIKTMGRQGSTLVKLDKSLAPYSFDWGRGNQIVFEGLTLDCLGTPMCMSTNNTDIYTIHSDGSQLRRLTNLSTATAPKWSADYTRILFVRVTGKPKKHSQPNRQLWTMHSDGSGLTRLTDANNVVAADWSPDGKQLAVVRSVGTDTGTGELQVWVGGADGAHLHLVADGISGSDASVDW